jgi:hypothetical protein
MRTIEILVAFLVFAAASVVAQEPARRPFTKADFAKVFETHPIQELTVLTASGRRTIKKGDIFTPTSDAFLVARTGERATVEKGGRRLVFPYLCGSSAFGPKLNLRVVAEYAGDGMRFSASERTYVGEALVGLVDSSPPNEPVDLPKGIAVALRPRPGAPDPRTVLVKHTNIPFERATIRAAEVQEHVLVRMTPEFDTKPVEPPLEIPVNRPAIKLRTDPIEIQGLGLETTTITVHVSGTHDNPKDAKLALHAGRGRFPDGNVVSLNENGTGSLEFRSGWMGTVEFEVIDWDAEVDAGTVEFVLPLAFLGFAVGGGLLGGIIRRYRKGTKWAMTLLFGVAVGVVVAAAWAVGVNLASVIGLEISVGFSMAAVLAISGLAPSFFKG